MASTAARDTRAAAIAAAHVTAPGAARGAPKRRGLAGAAERGERAHRAAVAGGGQINAPQSWFRAPAVRTGVTAAAQSLAAGLPTKRAELLRTSQAARVTAHSALSAAVPRRATVTLAAATGKLHGAEKTPPQAGCMCSVRVAAIGGAAAVGMTCLFRVHQTNRHPQQWHQPQQQQQQWRRRLYQLDKYHQRWQHSHQPREWQRHPQRHGQDNPFGQDASAAHLCELPDIISVIPPSDVWRTLHSCGSCALPRRALLLRCWSSAFRHHRRVQAPRLPAHFPPEHVPLCRNTLLHPACIAAAATASYDCSAAWRGDEAQRRHREPGLARAEWSNTGSTAGREQTLDPPLQTQQYLARRSRLRPGVELELLQPVCQLQEQQMPRQQIPEQQVLQLQQRTPAQEVYTQQDSRGQVHKRQEQQHSEFHGCLASVTSARGPPSCIVSHEGRCKQLHGRRTGTAECETTVQHLHDRQQHQEEGGHRPQQGSISSQLLLRPQAKKGMSSELVLPKQPAAGDTIRHLLASLMEAMTEYETLTERETTSNTARETRRIQNHVLQLHEAIAARLHEADLQQICELRGHVESLLFRQKLLSHHQLLVRLIEELYKRELVGAVCTSMLVRYFRDLCNASKFNVTVSVRLMQRLHATLMGRKTELLEKPDLANALVLFLYNSTLMRLPSGDLFTRWARLLLAQSRRRAVGGVKLRIAPPLIVFISRILVAERCGLPELWHSILDMTMAVDPRTSAEYTLPSHPRQRTLHSSPGGRCPSSQLCNVHGVCATDADAAEKRWFVLAGDALEPRRLPRGAAAAAGVSFSSAPLVVSCKRCSCERAESDVDSEARSPILQDSAVREAQEGVDADKTRDKRRDATARASPAANAVSAAPACSDFSGASPDVAAVYPRTASATQGGPLSGAVLSINKFSTRAGSAEGSGESVCTREHPEQGELVDAAEEARWLGNAMRTISGAADFCIPRHPAVDVAFERVADVAAAPSSDAHRLLFHCTAERHSMRLLHFLWSLCVYNFHLHPKFPPIMETCCVHGRLEYAAQCRLNFHSPAFIPFQTADAIMHDRRGDKSVAEALPPHCRNLMQAILMGVKPSCSLWASNFLSPHPLFLRDFVAVLET